MSTEQETITGRARYQPLRREVHRAAQENPSNRESHAQPGLHGFAPGVPQLLVYRDALGRNRRVSIQEAIKSARDENCLTEALFLSRFLSPSALVAEEVLRRQHNRAVEEARNAETGRDVRHREAEWGFALGPGPHAVGNGDARRAPSPAVRVAGMPAQWITADAGLLGEAVRPEPVAGVWPTWPETTPGDSAERGQSHHTGNDRWSDVKLQQGQKSQTWATTQTEIAAPQEPDTNATKPEPEHDRMTSPPPSRPTSTAQPQLSGRPSQASLRTKGSLSSYASTISLTHVDARSNLLDCDAMGGFFVVRQQLQEQQCQKDNKVDESDSDQEPFGTRAGIFRPLGREHHPNMPRKHSRECKSKCRDDGGEKTTATLENEEDDYVMVEKPKATR
ncbi:hypothetical protein PpBr36_04282 [Pyricularia pennisetigena]|uniref:hypothetical protein n=1 Tax=Pyricularia pennisetigena TaxID=1578925 RepID=UPI00114ED500|nr:hypothetical protein PpBr36_04282 [Pyricularia pennisetigena]TLS26751.1 hypothetical protein PpBr36_04282 [Pyricularia pennisetigena]